MIVGPKDAGKTRGLKYMINEWKNQGNIVFDFNLKGLKKNVASKEAMETGADTIHNKIDQFKLNSNFESIDCIQHNASSHCFKGYFKPSIQWVSHWFSYETVSNIYKDYKDLIVPILDVLLSCIVALFSCKYKFTWCKLLVFLLIMQCITFIFLAIIYHERWRILVAYNEIMYPLYDQISNGDWFSLFLCLQCIIKVSTK